MAGTDSDDYELMPKQEIDDLRREVNSLKKNSLMEGEKGKVLIDSIDRLAISINRLITILDDAQQDIIDEYQQSKPVEKLNQLLDQNEMIAKALVAISDNMSGVSRSDQNSNSGYNSNSGNSGYGNQNNSGMPVMPQAPSGMNPNLSGTNSANPRSVLPPMSGMNYGQNQNMNSQMNNMIGNSNQMSQMMGPPPMDDLPPMDAIPPLGGAPAPKKKFLGIM